MSEGATRSPNIWDSPDVYEVENLGVDRAGVIEAAMAALHPFAGADLLDVGCGSGFHLPRFRELGCASVVGVEPHPPLVELAAGRVAGVPGVRVLEGVAQSLPVPDASADIAHARWAYFFGPGCDPGLEELERVVRRGGTAMIIDNDASRSTFGAWFRRGFPHLPPPAEIERFWATRGWTRTSVDMGWRFESRADLESVVRIEFKREVADEILRQHSGLEVDYAVNLWSKEF